MAPQSNEAFWAADDILPCAGRRRCLDRQRLHVWRQDIDVIGFDDGVECKRASGFPLAI
jgi:DNA-binding LacI/PurR family transcriptional regulator